MGRSDIANTARVSGSDTGRPPRIPEVSHMAKRWTDADGACP